MTFQKIYIYLEVPFISVMSLLLLELLYLLCCFLVFSNKVMPVDLIL